MTSSFRSRRNVEISRAIVAGFLLWKMRGARDGSPSVVWSVIFLCMDFFLIVLLSCVYDLCVGMNIFLWLLAELLKCLVEGLVFFWLLYVGCESRCQKEMWNVGKNIPKLGKKCVNVFAIGFFEFFLSLYVKSSDTYLKWKKKLSYEINILIRIYLYFQLSIEFIVN